MNIKTTLATVSFLTLMAVSVPAMADTNVLCSVRANSQNVAGAAYTPGVDAKGRAVVPADTSKPVMGVPKTLTIPLTVDLAQRMNEVLPAGSKLEGQMGLVEVQQDGRVMINGKDMTGPADTMCSTIAKQKAAAMKTADAPKVAHPKRKKAVAKPVEAVTAEPVAAPAPEAVAAPAPTPASEAPKPEAAPAPAPQVLDATPPSAPPAEPVPQPAPIATPAPPSAPTLPAAPGATAPTPPPSGEAVTPAAPLDPLSPPPGAAPAPAPAPGANGTLSGGAQ
jgi:hypothetical protein